MKNMKVSVKIMLAFAVVFVLTGITGFLGISGLRQLNDASDVIYHSNTVPIKAVSAVRENLMTIKSDFMEIFHVTDSPDKMRYLMNHINEQLSEAAANFAEYEAKRPDWQGEADYSAARTYWDRELVALKNTVFEHLNAGRFDEAFAFFMGNETEIFDTLVDLFDLSIGYNSQSAYDANAAAESTFQMFRMIFAVALVLIISSGVFLAVYVSRLISKPLVVLAGIMEKVGSTGNMNVSADEERQFEFYTSGKDEIGVAMAGVSAFVEHVKKVSRNLEIVAEGDLTVRAATLSAQDTMSNSMNKMLDSLNEMFGEIKNASGQVTDGASQIADGASALASGSTVQAATVEQLSASIEDIAAKTRENAARSDSAARLANTIMANAERGNMQMEQMISAVGEINAANQNISKVIKAIDDIAFQTNILALNAAVEAARAGQAGKGFAVVAEEVRNLAAKSAESAKETGALISNSAEKAELGTKIAGETAASLNEIVEGIGESTKIISEIAQSSDEQSHAIEQINIGVNGVTQVIQQNSATAEQSAASSEEMSSQASTLEKLIARFKLR
jgi:methyl-accepting chemotaxis protein